MVQECYANTWVTKGHDMSVNPQPKKFRTMVREQLVDLSPESVRLALQLPQLQGDPYSYTKRANFDQRLDQVLIHIYVEGAKWRLHAHEKPYQLSRLDLKPVVRGCLELV